jgi:hypothetical protein
MTRLPAKVLSNEKRGDQYCLLVEIELSNFRRSFNSLRFGDQIPFSGSFRDGKLELRYYQNPGLEMGQPFPLWLSEFPSVEKRRIPKHKPIGHSTCGVSIPPLKVFAELLCMRKSVFDVFAAVSEKHPNDATMSDAGRSLMT